MRTKFEKWIEDQNFSEDVNALFQESVLCYKVSAYRASVIMSYLGVQTILRERLLSNQNKPNNISKNLWDRTLKDLKSDNSWDNVVFDMVNRQKPDNPFLITDDIRSQYSYWRTIRNDCAHAKSNIISYPHVESLWLFIESNLSKFIVNGGSVGLFERLKKHYDTKFTPPHSDVLPLVKEIPYTMSKNEILSFLQEINDLFNGMTLDFLFFGKDSESYNFWNYIANSENYILRESFIEFIKSNWDNFKKYIVVFPEKLYEVTSDEKFIREFWTTHIWELIQWEASEGWNVLKILLDKKIIPEQELEEFYDKLYDNTKNRPPELIVEYLKDSNYFKKLKDELFESSKMSTYYGIKFANENWDKIEFYLTHMPLDKVVVSELNSTYLISSYGKYYEEMTQLFEKNPVFKESYKQIIEKEQLKLSTTLENF